MVVVLPSACHNSSAICGANGVSNTKSDCNTCRLRQRCEVSSFTHIIKAATEALTKDSYEVFGKAYQQQAQQGAPGADPNFNYIVQGLVVITAVAMDIRKYVAKK